jgi:hypothetical protein
MANSKYSTYPEGPVIKQHEGTPRHHEQVGPPDPGRRALDLEKIFIGRVDRELVSSVFPDGQPEQVSVSAPVAGQVSVWTGERRRVWVTDHREALLDVLGRRSIAFGSHVEQSQKHYTFIEDDGAKLVVGVPEHHYEGPQWDDSMSAAMTVITIPGRYSESSGIPPATDTQWDTFSWWSTAVFEQAAKRADKLVITHRCSAGDLQPWVSAAADPDGFHIDTGSMVSDVTTSESVLSSAGRVALLAVGDALTASVRSWAISPLEVELSYIPDSGIPSTYL